jgi:hypothetical protein
MSRKVGPIIARGERTWLVRVYLGRDRETRERTYHNRTIYGSLRHAQAYLTRRFHERDLSRGVEGLQVTVDEFSFQERTSRGWTGWMSRQSRNKMPRPRNLRV